MGAAVPIKVEAIVQRREVFVTHATTLKGAKDEISQRADVVEVVHAHYMKDDEE